MHARNSGEVVCFVAVKPAAIERNESAGPGSNRLGAVGEDELLEAWSERREEKYGLDSMAAPSGW
jgi:hypothetical protein